MSFVNLVTCNETILLRIVPFYSQCARNVKRTLALRMRKCRCVCPFFHFESPAPPWNANIVSRLQTGELVTTAASGITTLRKASEILYASQARVDVSLVGVHQLTSYNIGQTISGICPRCSCRQFWRA